MEIVTATVLSRQVMLCQNEVSLRVCVESYSFRTHSSPSKVPPIITLLLSYRLVTQYISSVYIYVASYVLENSVKFVYMDKLNCLLKHVTEGKIQGWTEVTGRRRRRRKQLPDHLEETRGYWKLTEEALDHNLWSTRFGKVYGPAVRQITKWINGHGKTLLNMETDLWRRKRNSFPIYILHFLLSLLSSNYSTSWLLHSFLR